MRLPKILMVASVLLIAINLVSAQNTRVPRNVPPPMARNGYLFQTSCGGPFFYGRSSGMLLPYREQDPNWNFTKDFETSRSAGRRWVNGYGSCGWVEGHWVSDPPPQPRYYDYSVAAESPAPTRHNVLYPGSYVYTQYGQTEHPPEGVATKKKAEPVKPIPRLPNGEIDYETLNSLLVTSGGLVYVRSYTKPDGTFVPGHWKE